VTIITYIVSSTYCYHPSRIVGGLYQG